MLIKSKVEGCHVQIIKRERSRKGRKKVWSFTPFGLVKIRAFFGIFFIITR